MKKILIVLISVFFTFQLFAFADYYIKEMKEEEYEASKNDPNRSFETYTSAELREYIAKLPQTESDPEVIEFEKLALNSDDYLRPLEMSLYYQGWGKDIFNQFSPVEHFHPDKILFHPDKILFAPTNKQMREGKSTIRNAQKAFLYAVLAKTVNDENYNSYFVHPVSNLCCLYYEGIGTSKNYERIRKLYKVYIDSKEISYYRNCHAFFYYLRCTGEAGFKKEEELAPILLERWKNLYAGFFAPERKDFIIEKLSSTSSKSRFTAWIYEALVDIYSGKYNKADADPVKKAKFEKLFKEKLEAEMDNPPYKQDVEILKKTGQIYAMRYIYMHRVKILSNEYNKELSQKYFIKVVKRYKDMLNGLDNFLKWVNFYYPPQEVIGYRDLKEALPKIKSLAILSESDFNELQDYVEKSCKLYEHINENYYN